MTQPVEPEPTATPWREIFGPAFWLNYLACLLLTIWLPLVRMQAFIDGKPQGTPTYKPLYQAYIALWKSPTKTDLWQFPAIHLGLIFLVMAAVWYFMLRRTTTRKHDE